MPVIIHHHKHQSAGPLTARTAAHAVLPPSVMQAAWDAITNWEGYTPTPLHHLQDSAQRRKLGAIYYKDEAPRFGLNSFKALGGAYALAQLLHAHCAGGGTPGTFTAATATDGNHGRSVAWGAQRAGCAAKIFVHKEVSDAHCNNIARYGAEVIRISGDYDDSVRICREQAEAHNWQIISDTSWEGYTEVPRQVMAGYTVLMREALHQLGGVRPTHIILQAGVGAFAAAMIAAYLAGTPADTLPRILIVETAHADCLYRSAVAQQITAAPIAQETEMAGLSCGEPSLLAWQVLAAAATDFLSISDDGIAAAKAELAAAGIQAGECSTAGLAVLADGDDAQRDALGITDDSIVLIFGTEGPTA